MERITFSAKPKHEDIINDAREKHGVDSKAAAVRQCIESYADLHQEIEELEDEIAELKDEIDELNTEIKDERQERRMVLSFVMTDEVDAEQLEQAEHVEIDAGDNQAPTGSSLSSRIRWLLFGD